MKNSFYQRDIIAINDFSKQDILYILDQVKHLKSHPQPSLLQGFILASCFFEPSTRTRLSFEAAMLRLGGQTLGFSDARSISSKKGESLADTMRMVSHYADIIIIRHPLEGSAQHAADTVDVPVINAGDGANQHPTQTFLDLFTIKETQGTLEQLHIACVGDLKYGRTVHSLVQALTYFNARLYLISPAMLELPQEICTLLRERGLKFSFHKTLEEILDRVDILYMTRIQEERFVHKFEFEQTKQALVLKTAHLKNAKRNLKILHPLPRISEIDLELDQSPHAHYFKQAKDALFVREALLGLTLGKLE